MFERRNSHKPTLDLLSSFKDSFAQLNKFNGQSQILPATPVETSSAAEAAMSFDPSHLGDNEDTFDHVFNQDGGADWKSTDMFDLRTPGSLGLFDPLATPFQHTPNSSSYYSQNPVNQGTNQSQPGLMTPISRTVSHSGTFPGMTNYMSMPEYSLQQMPNAYDLDHFDPYSQRPQTMQPDYGYDVSQGQGSVNPNRLDGLQNEEFSSRFLSGDCPFRFRVALMTGTSMLRDGEHPVTYLNKCQPYKITIRDTRPDRQYWAGPVTYRTFIRISFNEQQQRERPAACWQLWKEGRGISEAHQRGGKLTAVEYVAQNQGHHHLSSSVELEHQTFDGFSVTWTAPPGRIPECEFQMRCNFLSTDFSHSKGVKGIPVRLCAKTKIIGAGAMAPPSEETCFCKVKLFRDHGAERKLSNDESHIKKAILKLEEQIKQSQAEHEEVLLASGKRRRSDSTGIAGRPSKLAKHRRASSLSSNSSNGLPSHAEGDLPSKLAALNRTLQSKREISLLVLKGEPSDDPDRHPVYANEASMYTHEGPADSISTESPQGRHQSIRSTHNNTVSGRSPSMSELSTISPRRRESNLQVPTPIQGSSQAPSDEWPASLKAEAEARTDIRSTNPQHLASPPDQQTKTEQRPRTDGIEGRTIDVLDADPSYVPAPKRERLPVACFYVRTSMQGKHLPDQYYRAIYLYERTLDAFNKAIALKNNLVPNQVRETIRVRIQDQDRASSSIQIKVDDEMVSEMVDGQDMLAEFSSATDSEREGLAAPYTLTVRF